ncbi:hypothetical protein BGW38_000785 [Lunasporangiospora selenospora]|uniref:Protein YIP n=1 Tax=Lunasporangiospora selenospora TaxID=979761 RepID=A0A9P6FUD2_9FUNG|nr:hypothetical protein BGW38_000785 [Lunasporangiospora selenospora]
MTHHSSSYSAVELDDLDATDLQFQSFSSSDHATQPTGNLSSSASTPQPRQVGFEPQRANQDANIKHPIWSLAFYAKFFDVDTTQVQCALIYPGPRLGHTLVLERCFASVIPKDNFLDVMGGNPDLYGPFWISTTVIFVLFVTSSIVDSIYAYMNGAAYSYDFFAMTFAFGAIYTYVFLVPLIVWGATKYYGCQPDLLEMLALYGYAMTIWIPVSVLSVIPIDLARWILLGIGAGMSGVFLVRNMYPVLSRAEAKTSKIILMLVIALHAALALCLKYRFFAYRPGTNDPKTQPPPPSS